MLRQHDNKSIHHHGLQYVDKRYIPGETACFLHEDVIRDGKCFIVLHVIFLFAQIVWRRIVDIVREIFVRIRIY